MRGVTEKEEEGGVGRDGEREAESLKECAGHTQTG